MPSNKDIKAAIAEATKNITDPEVIKALGGVNMLIDEKDKEDSSNLAKYDKLCKDYREAVMNAQLPGQSKTDGNGGAPENKSLSLEECVNQELSKGDK